MNLRSLTDTALVEKTEALAKDERHLLTTILHHLREIEQRRLFSAYGYKSLFEMTVRHFEYSEDAAYRRIAAMRVMAALPAVEEKINSGEINVTHLSMAQTHFRQEKKIRNETVPLEEQAALIEEMAGQSVREAEKTVLAHSSAPREAKSDRVKPLSDEMILMQFMASVALPDKIETLKGWLAHQHPGMSLGELFEKLCDLGLQEWDPRKVGAARKRRVKKSEGVEVAGPNPETTVEIRISAEVEVVGLDSSSNSNSDSNSKSGEEKYRSLGNQTKGAAHDHEIVFVNSERGLIEDLSRDREDLALDNSDGKSQAGAATGASSSKSVAPLKPCVGVEGPSTNSERAYIRAEVRRFVFQRANNQCELCGSGHAPEIDHVIPVAFGGSSEADNLRLLCRSCNQRAAIEKMGRYKMENYLQ